MIKSWVSLPFSNGCTRILTLLPLLVLAACQPAATELPAATEAGDAGWTEGAAMPTPRSEMPAVELDGLVYVPGGFGGESSFEVYDPAQDVWRILPDLPEPRHHLMAAALNQKIYIFGGGRSLNDWRPSAAAWSYDPATQSWTELQSMPEPRLGGAAVSLGGHLYVIGGVGGSNDLLRYDPESDRWERLAPLRESREHTAAAVLGGKIYALAGRWRGAGELSSVEVYDPAPDSWSRAESMSVSRAGFAAVAMGNALYVAGGEVLSGDSPVTLDSVERFDPLTGRWTLATALPVPLHGVPAVALADRILVVGGSERAGAIQNRGRVLIFQP